MDQDRYSAEFLDIVYEDYTNEKVTNSEIDFIVSKIKDGSRILDIGCGTGRHSIPLAKKGFDVVGLDNTKEMLRVLRNKLDSAGLKIDLLYKDILDTKEFHDEFDCVLCFWNAFDQIATEKEQGHVFFKTVYDSLHKGGKLILEISNPKSFDSEKFEYKSTVEKDGLTYETTFILNNYDKTKKTTLANESIIVKKNNEVIRKVSSDIMMRWWEKEEITALSKAIGFSKIEIYGHDFSSYKGQDHKMIFVISK